MRREAGNCNRVSIPKPGAPCTQSMARYRPVEATMDATVEEEVEPDAARGPIARCNAPR